MRTWRWLLFARFSYRSYAIWRDRVLPWHDWQDTPTTGLLRRPWHIPTVSTLRMAFQRIFVCCYFVTVGIDSSFLGTDGMFLPLLFLLSTASCTLTQREGATKLLVPSYKSNISMC